MTPPPVLFGALILTHGRPDRVYTLASLRKAGYTGPVYLVVDDEDRQLEAYRARYGPEMVRVFSKSDIASRCDEGDNFSDRRAILYARNASFEIARELGLEYFIQLDDDYTEFAYRFDSAMRFGWGPIKSLDTVFICLVGLLMDAPVLSAVCMAQGGDFIGGEENQMASMIRPLRKAMNTFVCCAARPFKFFGRINEDVNTYTAGQRSGRLLFLTTNQVSITQRQTQSNAGGMTDIYLSQGTYVKSFYSVMYAPGGVKVRSVGHGRGARLHRSMEWDRVAPLIVSERLRKSPRT